MRPNTVKHVEDLTAAGEGMQNDLAGLQAAAGDCMENPMSERMWIPNGEFHEEDGAVKWSAYQKNAYRGWKKTESINARSPNSVFAKGDHRLSTIELDGIEDDMIRPSHWQTCLKTAPGRSQPR